MLLIFIFAIDFFGVDSTLEVLRNQLLILDNSIDVVLTMIVIVEMLLR